MSGEERDRRRERSEWGGGESRRRERREWGGRGGSGEEIGGGRGVSEK